MIQHDEKLITEQAPSKNPVLVEKVTKKFNEKKKVKGQWRWHPDYPNDEDMIQVRGHLASKETEINSTRVERMMQWHGRVHGDYAKQLASDAASNFALPNWQPVASSAATTRTTQPRPKRAKKFKPQEWGQSWADYGMKFITMMQEQKGKLASTDHAKELCNKFVETSAAISSHHEQMCAWAKDLPSVFDPTKTLEDNGIKVAFDEDNFKAAIEKAKGQIHN